MHSISVKITAITIVAILTSILSVFAVSCVIIQRETDRNSVGMMNLIGQDTQKTLEKYFEGIEQSVEIAANIAIDNLDSVFLVESGVIRTEPESTQTEAQLEALDAYLADYCVKIQEYLSGVADYTHGITAYYYCINPDVSRREHGFYFRKIGKTGFIEQAPLDVQALAPARNLDGTWYEVAVRRGRPTWVGPYVAAASEDAWIYSYFVPIYKSGMLIGLMGMDIPCSVLSDQIRDIRIYETGFVCMLDAEGRVIYHPEISIGGELDEVALDVRNEILENQDSGDELIRYTVNGKKRQMSFSTLRNGMKLVSVAPSEEINAPWSRLIRAILMITVGIVIFYVVLTLFIMRVIMSPLRQLTAASQRLADAEYDVDLNYRGKDEIGTLTHAFTRMRDQIRHYIDDLNHQLYYDRLTDLPKMRHFFSIANKERERLLAENRQSVMLYFDIVGMRHYNRQYGFEGGDQLIAAFSKLLSEQFGERRVCRFNGDHFAAITDENNMEADIQAVLAACETALDGKRLPVRVGVYPNRLEHVDVNVACDRAQFAGDLNKGEVGSSVTYYDETMLRKGEIFRYIIHNLDEALDKGWVKVYYQPIIRTADGKVCDEEALARWIDPKLGFLSPGDFIPALEESKLIYKLDLYVVDQVLEKMRQQTEAGLYLVPQSINLSRMDFESCDIVEEIRSRVDKAGIAHEMITIEITESVIGSDFEFMKAQVARFRQMGFPVWMDDFGSGYSALDVLHQIRFDLIKFDMRFMERFDEGDDSRIILTELMRMAIGLGMETVCEGVEQAEQVEFLREIGCTRIQGYYYGKPIPFEGILSLIKKGGSLEFENPQESAYYTAIGRINLYDLTTITNEKYDSMGQYFNALPMSIIEVNGTRMKYVRCNRSYRDYLQRTLGMSYDTEETDAATVSSRFGTAFLKTVLQCSKDGNRAVVDEKVNEDTVTHTLIRRIAVNPVSGTAAIAVAVLAVIRESDSAGTNYSQMAKALAADYVDLYYVDLTTEQYIEYSPDAEREDLVMERHGDDFFATGRRDALTHLDRNDQENFVNAFTRENVVNALDTMGTFRITYRLLMDGVPTYVEMKAVRMPGDHAHIMVGVTNVDVQMRREEEMSRIQAEKAVYTRIDALTQNFICIYTIDPATGHYDEYRANRDYAGLGVPTQGEDFFEQSIKESERLIYPEDRVKFQTLLTRENILNEIGKNGVFSFRYRLMLDGEPRYMNLKAAMVEEQNGPVLVIGVNDIDAQVRREQEYERKLVSARSMANLDTLTGVRNRLEYEHMSETLSHEIEEGQIVRYAIVLCHVSEIATVNETEGRGAGDRLIRNTCDIICDVFKHSPVFRVAGDQFAVIVQGHDYDGIDALLEELSANSRDRNIAIAIGMARYDGSENVVSVFARAEQQCRGTAHGLNP